MHFEISSKTTIDQHCTLKPSLNENMNEEIMKIRIYSIFFVITFVIDIKTNRDAKD